MVQCKSWAYTELCQTFKMDACENSFLNEFFSFQLYMFHIVLNFFHKNKGYNNNGNNKDLYYGLLVTFLKVN